MDNILTNSTTVDNADNAGTNSHEAEALPAAANRPPVFCPDCKEQVGCRQQELKRHILSTHLPCWIYCPHPSCTWRGTRKEELNKHVDKEQCGPQPERDQYQIYDTRLILGWILEDDIPLNVAVGYALDFVGERAMELGKVEAWRDLWGRQSQAR